LTNIEQTIYLLFQAVKDSYGKLNKVKFCLRNMSVTLVYLVAGMSSRFGGRIKQFAIIDDNGQNLIEYSMSQAIKAGIDKIVFVVGKMTEKPFKDKFKDSYKGVKIKYAKQEFNPSERDKPWGTVDALCCAKELLSGPFIVCNGDDIYGESSFSIIKKHLETDSNQATIGFRLGEVLPEKGTTNRGIFKIKNEYVSNLVENFDIEKDNLDKNNLNEDDLCSMNFFGLHQKVLDYLSKSLIKFKDEHNGDRKIECLLPNNISSMIESGNIKMKVYPAKDKWYGVTNPGDEEIIKLSLKEANRKL
jgi:NDP-sugar pyrophosphorylase family protein